MRSIKTLANCASGMMWETLPLVLLHHSQVNEESHILVTFGLHCGLCLDFLSILKIVVLLIKNQVFTEKKMKGKIKVVTKTDEFIPWVHPRGNE